MWWKLVDKVGLGWRSEIAASIFLHLEQIDVVEVIMDDYFGAPRSKLSSLATLNAQVDVIYHGVGLGLASAFQPEQKRIDKIARFLDVVKADQWSEHLAFVRAGQIEVGHLAAPPRNDQTIECTLKNLDFIKKTIMQPPALENVATLINPPNSTMGEGAWLNCIFSAYRGGFLLDLHNLYANALNFGFSPSSYLKKFPLGQVSQVHLSGGKWIVEPGAKNSRLLDDHVHDVPEAVYELLTQLASLVSQPLTVIVERDGAYPEFKVLLEQMARAKRALKKGRRREVLHERTVL